MSIDCVSPGINYSNVLLGKLIGFEDQRPLISLEGEEQREWIAKVACQPNVESLDELVGTDILVAMASEQPVIIGFVRDTIEVPSQQAKSAERTHGGQDDVLLSARNQLKLECGKSSITLKKSGKILLQGVDLVSKASRRQRIKGATVEVN